MSKGSTHITLKQKLYEEVIALNNSKLSQISLEIESLRSHIKEFKSNSTTLTSDNNIDINHKDGRPFTCNEVGHHIINKSYTIDDNPTSNIESYQDSCIPKDLKCRLVSYLSENFNNDKVEGKYIAIYGHNLLYLKTNKSKNLDIPNIVKDVIKLIDPENDKKVNSVIISKYSNDSPPIDSSFTDKCITPESDISTFGIGGKLNVLFRDKVTGIEKSLKVEDASCFTMSQQSQFYWTHKLMCESNISETPQYSISLLCTGRHNNSTLIVGDSNTFNIKFHNESSYYSNLNVGGELLLGGAYSDSVFKQILIFPICTPQ